MKILLPFLLICFFCINSFAQEVEELPEMPWANIAEMNLQPNIDKTNWINDVHIKLQGFYSEQDSLIVLEAIQQLDSLTETISIGFSESPRGNLEIFILDSPMFLGGDYYVSSSPSPNNLRSNINSTSVSGKGRLYTRLYIIRGKTNKDRYPLIIKNKIATALVNGGLSHSKEGEIAKNRNSIFNPIHDISNGVVAHNEELNKLDIAIIRENYKKGYKEKLEIAKQQFKPTIISMEWWRKANPYIYMLFPLGLLIFMLLPFYMRLTRIITQRINNKLVTFNISGIIGILILATIGLSYSGISNNLARGYRGNISLMSLEFLIFYGTSLVIGLVTINLIRVIEVLIHKNTYVKGAKIVFIFLSTGLIPFVALLTFYHLTSNRNYNSDGIKGLSIVFLICMVIAGFRTLISYFFFKEKDLILENETKLSKLRELKTKAELNALHSRINPHFLYNSLNSIAGLAHSNADKTEHMALSLSKLFRYSINKEKSDWTTFKEELDMVRIYLDVEKVRFDDRLSFSVEIDDELKEQRIPRFLIQPLVENAVKHGISKSIEGGEIKIRIAKEKKNIVIAVSDSGQEFPADLTPGFGLQSIYDKLEILYKDKFEMSFANSPLKQVILKLK